MKSGFLCVFLFLLLLNVMPFLAQSFEKRILSNTVKELNLITSEVSPSAILDHALAFSDPFVKRFPLITLAFIRPSWNKRGVPLAFNFRKKLNYVSPKWYVCLFDGNNLDIRETEKPDLKWAGIVRGRDLGINGDVSPDTHLVKIVPCVSFAEWTEQSYEFLLSSKSLQNQFVTKFADLVTGNGYQGLVFDLAYAWTAVTPSKRHLLNLFVIRLGDHFHTLNPRADFILTAAPVRVKEGVDPKKPGFSTNDLVPSFSGIDMESVGDFVDFVAVQSNDFDSSKAGPNAPIVWMNQSVHFVLGKHRDSAVHHLASKILMGLNVYGNLFRGVIKHQSYCHNDLLNALRDPSCLVGFEPVSMEHYFHYIENGIDHYLFFPTLFSIESRLNMAIGLKLGGITINDIGLGCDYFFDLF